LSTVRQELEKFAEGLVHNQRCPIELSALLARLRVGLEIRAQESGSPLGALHERSGRPVIVVHSDRPTLQSNPRARFTVAHELGHWVLETWGVDRPSSRREYWAREADCNAFAAALLVPRPAVDYALRPRPTTPGELYSRLRLVAERARVSSETTCRRILAEMPAATVWEARDAPQGRDDLIGVVAWAHGAEHLGMRRGVHVREEHQVAGLLRGARELRPGAVVERHLGDQHVVLERRRNSTLAVSLDSETPGQQRLLDAPARVALPR
jgi:Zn-dependent peptidase ImmA (M78 family)